MTIAVTLAWVEGDEVRQHLVQLGDGATVAEAIALGIAEGCGLSPVREDLALHVFGKRRSARDEVHDGDRIELLEGLRVDPKTARARRVAHQRASAGRHRWNPSAG